MEIAINLFYQLLFTVGVVAGFGLLIAFCRRAFCRIVGRKGTTVLLITGVVGTPIHELSHALACVLFGHKVTEIKLYRPGANDGTLGYVNHSYNPKNLYHQIGNFFIGTAPVICGSGVLLLLSRILVPSVFSEIEIGLSELYGVGFDFPSAARLFLGMIAAVFAPSNFTNAAWWAFIILALMISSHMELSTADIKGGFAGFLFIALAFLLADIALFFVGGGALSGFTSVLTSYSIYIIGFLAISLVFSLALVAIAAILKIIFK